jgi:hypothetical protein
METYFNHPDALTADPNAVVSMGEAMAGRIGGLVVNTIISLVEGMLGFWFGSLLPKAGSNAAD